MEGVREEGGGRRGKGEGGRGREMGEGKGKGGNESGEGGGAYVTRLNFKTGLSAYCGGDNGSLIVFLYCICDSSRRCRRFNLS